MCTTTRKRKSIISVTIKLSFANGGVSLIMKAFADDNLNLAKPFPKRQILDTSKLKGFADDNFKFDKNVRKFYRRVENTVGKGEIARYEQFLLFPQCFQKTCTADT